jgi:hypothetical protein
MGSGDKINKDVMCGIWLRLILSIQEKCVYFLPVLLKKCVKKSKVCKKKTRF